MVKAAGFDLVIVETPGIGQGDAAIVPFVDTSMYVMTPEFGAASQLEKIDMLDFADVVAINKFERRGAKDALRDVGRQLVRNREAFGKRPEDMPVIGTSAATFNDDGVTALYQYVKAALAEHGLPLSEGTLAPVDVRHSSGIRQVVPATGCATSPRSPTRSAGTTPPPSCWPRPPGGFSAWRPSRVSWSRPAPRRGTSSPCSTAPASSSRRASGSRSPTGRPSWPRTPATNWS